MILLDTHVVLWWQAGGARLSAAAAREIAKAEVLLVSPITCWEIATLAAKKRIALDRDVHTWVRDLLADERIEVAPLTPQAATSAGLLDDVGFPGDPTDRFLYATAREQLTPLVTEDGRIRTFARSTGDLRTIW